LERSKAQIVSGDKLPVKEEKTQKIREQELP